MSQLKYLYTNHFDTATLTPSSEVTQLPVENVQREILGTVWRTKTGFTITGGFNDAFGFKATSTGSVQAVTVASGSYTGVGLASQIQTQMRSATSFSVTVTYNDTATNAFMFATGATATALSLYFNDYASSTVAVDLGFDPYTDYTGVVAYSGSVSLAGQEWVQATIATGTSSYLVMDGYNLPADSTVLLRLADQTSSFSGLREGGTLSASVTVTLLATQTVYELPAAFSGLGVQISFHNSSVAYTDIGRIWIGPAFSPANRVDNVISWDKKRIIRKSQKTKAYGGATYFDKRDPVDRYTIPVEVLDPYYDAVNKAAYETFFDTVGDDQSFYTLLESDLTKVIYGFIVGNTDYGRLKNTTSINVKAIVIEEQK